MDQRMGDLDRQSRVILRNQLQPYFDRFENDGIYYDKPENLFSMTADADAFEHQKQLDAAENRKGSQQQDHLVGMQHGSFSFIVKFVN